MFAFGILGPLTASRDGEPLALGSPQQRALLAVLIEHAGQVVTRDRLVDAVWGDKPGPAVGTSIRAHVSHLRDVLEPDRSAGEGYLVLTTETSGYRLAVEDEAVDARRFEKLARQGRFDLSAGDQAAALAAFDEALSLWRGDVLSDLRSHPFVDSLATRLGDVRIAAEEGWVQAHLDLGHDTTALAYLDRLVREHPLREGLFGQRMLALYRTGRQAEALATYRELRDRLADELGIEPNRALRRLQQQVLQQDPTLLRRTAQSDNSDVGVSALSAATEVVPPDMSGTAGSVSSLRLGSRRRLSARRLLVALVACGLVGLVLADSRPGSTATRTLLDNAVEVLDSDGRVVDQIAVGTTPGAMAFGGGSVWVANQSDNTVMRIDPLAMTVTQRFVVGIAPTAIVATDDDVWVANFGDATVTRINIAGNRVSQAVPVGARPAALTAGADGIWVANSADNTVQRIDPASGTPGPAFDVGDGPDGLLVMGDTLWVANGRDGTLSRLAATSGRPVPGPLHTGSGPRGLVAVGDDVWVADQLSQSVTRIDATSRTHPVYVPDGPTAVVEADGAVWASSEYAGSLTRIEPDTSRLTTVPLGGSPLALAEVYGRLWVSVGAAGNEAHRGGTLTVAAAMLPGSRIGGIDPADVFDITTSWPERLVYEGLFALRYFSDDSQTLVPNLATAIPTPTDRGRTYTLTIRPGIRYSTGAVVTATDIARGMRRALTGDHGGYYSALVGAHACLADKAACDLSGAVEADDSTGTVIFHLTAADPDFLYKLAWLVYPTPATTGPDDGGIPPGTGPYLIADHVANTSFVLTRNPMFERSWSVPAVPSGYPDVIRWLKVDDTAAAVAAVDAGRADLAELTPLGDRTQTKDLLSDLSVRRPAQIKTGPAVGTSFIALNSSHYPFDHLDVRRAINFAVDRSRLVELAGGPLAAEPSCQLSIPGYPGYQRYCPYTTSPDGTRWLGPDLETARRLVAGSGTAGAHVTVADLVGDFNPPFDAYIADVLRELGYDVELRVKPVTDDNERAFYDPASDIDAMSGGWLPDYPRPSNFYDPILRCDTDQPYPFVYCDRATDTAADAARALQDTDPGRALQAWAAVQHTVVDQAPVVFGLTNRDVWYAGPRVGNYQQGAIYGPLFSQIWVH